jgi:hypothetical protein
MTQLEFTPCNGNIAVELIEKKDTSAFEYEKKEDLISMARVVATPELTKNDLKLGSYVWFETRFLTKVSFNKEAEFNLIPESCIYAMGKITHDAPIKYSMTDIQEIMKKEAE